MRRAVIAAALFVAGCGDDEPSRGIEPLRIETPVTIVGELEIAVEEGPVGADDLSEVNFGSVDTADGVVLIEVWADVVRASGLGRDQLVGGGRFRVELEGPAEYATSELPSYLVSALSPDE